jgi:hypothetical protein
MGPAVKRIRDRPGLDAADHDPEDGGEPNHPDRAHRQEGVALDRGRDAPAEILPRRNLADGRNALRHERENSARLGTPEVGNPVSGPKTELVTVCYLVPLRRV